MMVSGNVVLRGICGLKRENVRRRRKLHNEKLNNFSSSPNTVLSESRSTLRSRYVDMVVSIEVAV
jgi:hypothetical protein